MLRGLVICPDPELAQDLNRVLVETRQAGIVRDLSRYPDDVELMRTVRAHAPQVVFVSTESIKNTLDIVACLETQAPGLPVVAVGRTCDPSLLLDVMRAGVREFLAMPFSRQLVYEALLRIEDLVAKRPLVLPTTDLLFSFIPAKAGVGSSTLALNTALALGRLSAERTLLVDLDLNSGILGFLMKLNSGHSILDAAQNSSSLDESIWPQLVAQTKHIDVLQSGRVNPGVRIESSQIHEILDFARRHYKAICVDLSGNMERFSIEIMQESKRIFMVCTPEVAPLHLAREKLAFLRSIDLGDRVSILFNRTSRRSVITQAEAEKLLEAPVHMSFPNDYAGVHRAIQEGTPIPAATELGHQFEHLASDLLESKIQPMETKRKFIEFFSVIPSRYSWVGTDRK